MIIAKVLRYAKARARAARREAAEWGRALLRSVPGEIGCALRRRLYGFRAGEASRVLSDVVIYYPENLTIGRRAGISCHCQFNAGGGIEIGDDVLIGPGALIWSQNHRYSDHGVPINSQGYDRSAVRIEDDVWIGAGSIILPGVCLGRGTVVAAGSVVTESTVPYTIVAGAPARVLKRRGPDDWNDPDDPGVPGPEADRPAAWRPLGAGSRVEV
jgi:acetyltransferase-like isoleucine patch superfamily enzyme